MPFASKKRSWSFTYFSVKAGTPFRLANVRACSLAAANTAQLCALGSPRRGRHVYVVSGTAFARSVRQPSVTSFGKSPAFSTSRRQLTISFTPKSFPTAEPFFT